MSENEKTLNGTDLARKEKTEVLLRIAETAKNKSVTRPEKFRETFPDLAYNYSQISSVLKERGYSVRWTSDALSEENRTLRESLNALEKENESLKEKLEQSQAAPENTRILRLKRTYPEEKTVYMSLPVKESTAKRWKKMFGMLHMKVLFGTTALDDFMDAIIEKKIRVRM